MPGIQGLSDISSVEGYLEAIAGLVKSPYDYIETTATNANGDPTTIVYKNGGSGGVTVATLTITYDANGNFESVTSA